MIDTTIHPADLLTADPSDVAPVVRELPVWTIEDTLRRARKAGRWTAPIARMLYDEIRRRCRETELRTTTTVTIPPIYRATPMQIRGALMLAGVTVRDVAAEAQVAPSIVYRVISGEVKSDHVALVITRAMQGKLHHKEPI